MPYVRSRYYREEEKPAGYRRVEAGFGLLEKNMEKRGFRAAVQDAMAVCAEKSRQMSK